MGQILPSECDYPLIDQRLSYSLLLRNSRGKCFSEFLIYLSTIRFKWFSYRASRAAFVYDVYAFQSKKSILICFVFNMKRSEHERHSPNCPFVKGEHTQNVPLSVTLATSPAQFPCTDGTDRIACFGSGSCPHFLAAATKRGKICIWDVSKLMKVYNITNFY